MLHRDQATFTGDRNKDGAMTMTTPERGAAEPRLVIPALAPFYGVVRELSYPLIRITVGGTLLVHGIVKLMGPPVAVFAQQSMAKRGIEPALLVAYIIFINETVGAACVILGLFTRFFAASIAIEMAVITFLVFLPHGYGFTLPGGGWEYPLLWGLIFFAIALRGGGPYSLDRKLGWEL
jgi:putative oxidoreductase